MKEPVDIFGNNGGLIVDCAIGIPDEAKPENVYPVTQAVYDYGVCA